jgi:hypothetical protein
MFTFHAKPWEYIFIDHYYKPNIIVGVLEGIWFDTIHGYAKL